MQQDGDAKYGSMVCAVQSMDYANPYFAPNIYILIIIITIWVYYHKYFLFNNLI